MSLKKNSRENQVKFLPCSGQVWWKHASPFHSHAKASSLSCATSNAVSVGSVACETTDYRDHMSYRDSSYYHRDVTHPVTVIIVGTLSGLPTVGCSRCDDLFLMGFKKSGHLHLKGRAGLYQLNQVVIKFFTNTQVLLFLLPQLLTVDGTNKLWLRVQPWLFSQIHVSVLVMVCFVVLGVKVEQQLLLTKRPYMYRWNIHWLTLGYF